MVCTFLNLFAGTTRIKPIPMLKVRSISSWGTLPIFCRCSKMGGTASGRPQRTPSSSQFLGAAAAYPAAVAPAHGFLGHAPDDFRRDAVARDRLPARSLHCVGLRRRPEYRRLRRRL